VDSGRVRGEVGKQLPNHSAVYLWWPRSWTWRALKTSLLFNVRLCGKARDWNWHNVNVRVKDMAHYAADALSQESASLSSTSTYGNGDLPDDAAPFCEAITHGKDIDMRGLKFSVLALGNPS
jgi:Flavodoxin